MKASITVRLDEDLKAQAEAAMALLDISPTKAITHFYQYLAQHRQLPFRITTSFETPGDVWQEATNKLQTGLSLIRSFCQAEHGSTEYFMAKAMTPSALVHAADYITANRDYFQQVRRRFSDKEALGLMLPAVEWGYASLNLNAGARLIAGSGEAEADLCDIDATGDRVSQNLTRLLGYFHSPLWEADAN